LIMFIPPFFFCDNVSNLVFGNSDYSTYFRIIALDFPFITFFNFVQDVLRLSRQSWKYLFFTIGSILSNITLTILIVVVLRKGIFGVFLSKLIVDALFTFIALFFVRNFIARSITFSRLKQLFAYGIPLVPAGVSYWVLNMANRYFVRYYISLSDVGLFSIGNKIASLLGLVSGSFQLAWGPFAFSIHRDEDSREVYANVFTYYLVTMSGIGIGLSIFSLEVLKIFTNELYYGAAVIVPYLVFSIIGYGAYYIVAIGVNITRKTSHIGWTTTVAAVINIALNFVLIPKYGIIGASLASCISFWASTLLLYLVSQHYYPINYRLDKAAIILSSSIILIIIGNFIKFPNLLLAIVLKFILFIAYFLILMTTSIIKPDILLRILKGFINKKFN